MIDRLKRAVRKPEFWGAVAFVVLFIWGILRQANAAELDALIGVASGSTHNSQLMIEEVFLEFDHKWDVGVFHMSGDPRITSTYGAVAAYRVRWREDKRFEPWASFGAAYFDRAPEAFVSENLSYQLAVGFRMFKVLDLGWVHYSTAGRARTNWGVDYVSLRVVLPIHQDKEIK